MQALAGGRVLLPDGIREDVPVLLQGDRIVAVGETIPAEATRIDLAGGLLLPGFIDTQVNGGGGILFNDAPTVGTLACMAAAHRRFGTTGLLPTLISDDLGIVAAAIRAVEDAISDGVPGILGIHIEGPFLNVARRGIHAARHIRTLDQEALALLCAARRGRTLITLAPECVQLDDLRALRQAGVVVAAGHSEASYECMMAAVDAGITGVTHLFNAMSQLTSRAPGVTGAALLDDRITAGLIVDGQHVHPAAIRLALRAKGPEGVMLVTDAMSLTDGEQTEFILQGRSIRRDGDRLVDDANTLAGSTLTMAAAVRNMISMGGADLPTAVRMASATPAAFLGLQAETGSIAPGLRADLILVDDDLTVVRSWVAGHEAG